MENNRDIENARKDALKANLQIMEVASTALPSINGFWNYEHVIEPMVFVIEFPDSAGTLKKHHLKAGTDNSMFLGAALTQPLYMGGKVGTALKAAKIYKKVSEETLESIKQNVFAGVVMVFNSALFAKEMLRINQESLAQAERHLGRVKSMYEAGSATKYDLLRARVRVSNLKPDLLKAENQVTISYLKIKEVLSIKPDVPLSIKGSFAEPDTSIFANATIAKAFNNRPDLKASEYSVDLYEKYIKIARGDFLPTLTAGTTFQYMGNFDTFKYDADTWNPYWTANIQLSFPIFSGFRNSSKYRQAQTDFFKARTTHKKTYDAVHIEVREGILNLRNAMKTIENQRMNIEEAEMALEMAESLFENGKATQLEVLDSQLALDAAKTNMVAALYEASIAEIMLKKGLGLLNTNL